MLEIGLDGKVNNAFFDMDGSHVSGVSSALVSKWKCCTLGSITEDQIAVLDLAQVVDGGDG